MTEQPVSWYITEKVRCDLRDDLLMVGTDKTRIGTETTPEKIWDRFESFEFVYRLMKEDLEHAVETVRALRDEFENTLLNVSE